MRILVSKATWCLPLWAALALVLSLVHLLFPNLTHFYVPATDNQITLGFAFPDLLFQWLSRLAQVFFFTGMAALLLYVADKVPTKQARYALALLLLAQLISLTPSYVSPTSGLTYTLQNGMTIEEWMERPFRYSH